MPQWTQVAKERTAWQPSGESALAHAFAPGDAGLAGARNPRWNDR